jgi:ribosomal protein S28E/S33
MSKKTTFFWKEQGVFWIVSKSSACQKTEFFGGRNRKKKRRFIQRNLRFVPVQKIGDFLEIVEKRKEERERQEKGFKKIYDFFDRRRCFRKGQEK